MTGKAKNAVLKMKNVPLGIICGSCGVVVLLACLGLVAAYIASAVVAETSAGAAFLGTWYQALIFVVAVIAAAAGICALVFFILKNSVVPNERSDCFYELDKIRYGEDYLQQINDRRRIDRENRAAVRAEKRAARKEKAAAKKRMSTRKKTEASIVAALEIANAQFAVIDKLKSMLDDQARTTNDLCVSLEQANARIVALENGGKTQGECEQVATAENVLQLESSVRENSEFIAELKAQREKRKAAARDRAKLVKKDAVKKPTAKEQMENMQRELAELRALLESVANRG